MSLSRRGWGFKAGQAQHGRQQALQPERGKVTVAGWPLQMSGSHVPIRPAPLHGGNNEDVYGEWLGIEADEVKAMRERGEI